MLPDLKRKSWALAEAAEAKTGASCCCCASHEVCISVCCAFSWCFLIWFQSVFQRRLKPKQLAWDRAYDANGNLCYLCYYDARNSVYAGFMKSILTPEDRRELYNGVTDPRDELLGDTLELALGILRMAIRFPNHFINWGGSEGPTVPTPVCGAWKDRFGGML